VVQKVGFEGNTVAMVSTSHVVLNPFITKDPWEFTPLQQEKKVLPKFEPRQKMLLKKHFCLERLRENMFL